MSGSVADAVSAAGNFSPVNSSSLSGGGMSAGLDNYLKQYGELINDERKNATTLRQKGNEIAEGIEKDRKEISETQIPKIPQLTPVPKIENRDPFQAFGSSAGWLAVFGSMLTRQPLTSSLKAASGVMNAWKEQDANKAKQQFEVWKAETENATKLHDYQMENYNAAIDRLKSDREAGTAEIQALAASYKDDSVLLLAQKGMTDEAVKLITERDKQFNKVNENASKLEAMNNYMLWLQTSEGQKSTPEEKSKKLMQMTSPTVAAAGIKTEEKNQKETGGIDDLVSQIDEAIASAKTAQTTVGGVGLAPTGVQGMAARAAEGTGLADSSGDPDNPSPATDFKTNVKLISDQAQKILAKGRYSAAAAKDMKDALAATGAFTSPETATSGLNRLKKALIGLKASSKENEPSDYSQEDLEYTAKKYGITVDEVKQRLGVQ